MRELNLTGHPSGLRYYVPERYQEYGTTHNTILQVAYESGIPAGICYFIYNIFSGFAAIWYAVRHRDEDYSLFPLAAVLSFGVMSCLGSLLISFSYPNTLYYFLVQFPLIARPPERLELEQTSPANA